ncbi:hypothetical protein PGTUg99_013603 [Puccinia graminis f. sp. tritici]|uniref:Uncharacterized protein n=1 Tax=Puccinia graminis f. sp. tritici TaxID=56615 RepID=A0A5B0R5V4_PUCGR|nr:hypothetical protein PGTUg99_013603 [Puccinia graminis f. sp. tritici]
MTSHKVIFGIFVAFTSAYLALCGNIPCLLCGKEARLVWKKGMEEEMADCGAELPNREICKVQRTKKYYRCSPCSAMMVKNKQCPSDNQEGCGHENRKVISQHGKPLSEASSSQPVGTSQAPSSQPVVPSEEIPGTKIRMFHFLR